MIHRQPDVCKCGHSAMVHIGKCWGKSCKCKAFILRTEEKNNERNQIAKQLKIYPHELDE